MAGAKNTKCNTKPGSLQVGTVSLALKAVVKKVACVAKSSPVSRYLVVKRKRVTKLKGLKLVATPQSSRPQLIGRKRFQT